MYRIDLEARSARQVLNWNDPNIEWFGSGGDRGLRGLAFDEDRLFVASGDRLLAFGRDLKLIDSWRNPYLKHCRDIAVWQRTLYLCSAGYDTILGFHLDEHRFHWALHVQSAKPRFGGTVFDPLSDKGPLLLEKLRLRSLYCDRNGMYIAGLKTGGMLHFNGEKINMAVELPEHTYDARPFRDGVIFNDNEGEVLRYTGRGEGEEDRAMPLPDFELSELEHIEAINDRITRPRFASGLCILSDRLVAGGCSPATVSLYDLAANKTLGSISLSNDVRNTIHSIAVWPD